jgi:hypothetical protein
MSKKSKNCLVTFTILLIISVCSFSSFFGGVTIGIIVNDEKSTPSDQQIVEKKVYYEDESTQRYFDENSDAEIYEQLLSDAEDHFTFTYEVENKKQFKDDADFILANLEYNHSRLAVKFNINITEKIEILLVDDLDTFGDDLGVELEGPYSHHAFSLGTDLIEIYINPIFTIDKFDLANIMAHELVHIYQFNINEDISYYDINWMDANWYIEGMAESLAVPNEDPIIHKDIYEKVEDVNDLNNLLDSVDPENYLIGYQASELFFTYLSDTYGEERLLSLLDNSTDFNKKFESEFGLAPDEAFLDWIETL